MPYQGNHDFYFTPFETFILLFCNRHTRVNHEEAINLHNGGVTKKLVSQNMIGHKKHFITDCSLYLEFRNGLMVFHIDQ